MYISVESGAAAALIVSRKGVPRCCLSGSLVVAFVKTMRGMCKHGRVEYASSNTLARLCLPAFLSSDAVLSVGKHNRKLTDTKEEEASCRSSRKKLRCESSLVAAELRDHIVAGKRITLT
jgi:hypothetical protein